MIVDFPGEVVGFSGCREGVNEVYQVFQLKDSILVNGIEDRVHFCDIRLLSIPRCCPVLFSGWDLIF